MMRARPPELEFLPAPPWRRWWGHAVLALGLAACVASGLRYGHAVDGHEQALARLTPQAASPQAAPLPPALRAEIDAARAAAQTLALPWDAWFRALEAVAVPGVRLAALQPEAGGQRLRLVGQAGDLGQALDYVDALERSPALRGVLLVDHALQEDAPGAPLRFTLTVEWESAP